jgi:hypothetical protein
MKTFMEGVLPPKPMQNRVLVNPPRTTQPCLRTFEVYRPGDITKFLYLMANHGADLHSVTPLSNILHNGWLISYWHTECIGMEVRT